MENNSNKNPQDPAQDMGQGSDEQNMNQQGTGQDMGQNQTGTKGGSAEGSAQSGMEEGAAEEWDAGEDFNDNQSDINKSQSAT